VTDTSSWNTSQNASNSVSSHWSHWHY
jgi:hypothetical protein